MKKRILAIMLSLALAASLLPVGTMAAWSTDYTLTGNAAQDIINVAVAQKGKTGSDLGYNSDWCAYFVYDCAKKANVSGVPKQGYASSLFRVMTGNGIEGNYFTDVTKQNSSWTGGRANGTGSTGYDVQYCTGMNSSSWTPKVGDIVFFTYKGYGTIGHVGMVQSVSGNSISVVHGNWSKKVTTGTVFTKGAYSSGGYAICAYARLNSKTTAMSVPAAPSNVFTATWNDAVQVQWTRDSKVDYYECTIRDLDTHEVVMSKNVDDWYYVFYGVPEGKYWVAVYAHNSAGHGPSGEWQSVNVIWDAPKEPVLNDVAKNYVEGDSVTVSWNSVENADKYVYYLTEFPEGYAYSTNRHVGTVKEPRVTFNDLQSGKYTIFVHAISDNGKQSGQSNRKSFNVYANDYRPTKVVSKNEHIYAIYDYEMSWSFARDLCKNFGGHLVTITDATENALVNELIQSGKKESYWLGATDWERTTNDFAWVTGEAFSYTNWMSSEPNNAGEKGTQEHFVEARKSYGNKWNDVNNINKSNKGFILEIDANNIKPTVTKTYDGNQYLLFDQNITWSEAKAFCEMLGGHLATASDQEEYRFLQSLTDSGKRAWYLLGAEKQNGSWVWIDGSSFSGIEWASTASKWKGPYLMMYQSSKQSVGFDNAYYPAEDIKYVGFICEIKGTEEKPETNIPEANITEVHFPKVNVYTPGQFTDVPPNQWFTENVAEAVRFGLMKGNSETTFNPYGDVTLAEAITMAARLHSIYTTGSESFVQGQGQAWYQVYLDYARQNSIIGSDYYNADVTQKATRAQFAEIFANALPDKALGAKNQIADNAIPDVPMTADYAGDVYKLYRAGILAGGDAKGTFSPLTFITRAECATIVARMADSDNRMEFTL